MLLHMDAYRLTGLKGDTFHKILNSPFLSKIMKYIIDSNSFITPHRTFCPTDVGISCWNLILKTIFIYRYL